MTFALVYVMAIFILRIKFFENLETTDWIFIMGFTWDDPNNEDSTKSIEQGFAGIVIAIAQFVSSQVYLKAFSSF